MAYEVPPAALRLRRARAAHRRGDDARPPRQAPPGLRGQGQRGARGHRVGRQADRGGPPEPRRAARRQAERRPQQRRRPLQPHAVLGVDEPGRRRRARRRPRRRDRLGRSAPSPTSRPSSRRPASTSSAPAGRGSCTTARASPWSAPPTRTPRSPTARRRCWASTSGSTPTTSSTRTSARTTSTRGGTWSTGEGRRALRGGLRTEAPLGSGAGPGGRDLLGRAGATSRERRPRRLLTRRATSLPDRAEAERLGRWRALGARSKGAHVAAQCERAGVRAALAGGDRLRGRLAARRAERARRRAGAGRVRALGARRRDRRGRATSPAPGGSRPTTARGCPPRTAPTTSPCSRTSSSTCASRRGCCERGRAEVPLEQRSAALAREARRGGAHRPHPGLRPLRHPRARRRRRPPGGGGAHRPAPLRPPRVLRRRPLRAGARRAKAGVRSRRGGSPRAGPSGCSRSTTPASPAADAALRPP